MTQAELEQIASQLRARGLHSSWNDLIEFSRGVVGGLVEAYQALLRDSASLGSIPSSNPENVQIMVRDRLVKALTLLTSETQVAGWKSEVLGSNYTAPI
jgi:hypothetical protein